MFNFIDIYMYVCMGTTSSALLCPGTYNIVKMVLNIMSVKYYPAGKLSVVQSRSSPTTCWCSYCHLRKAKFIRMLSSSSEY